MQSVGFSVQGSGYRVQGSECRAQGSGFRVQGSGFRVQGSGFRLRCCLLKGLDALRLGPLRHRGQLLVLSDQLLDLRLLLETEVHILDLISHNVFINQFQKVNSPTKL